MRRAALALALLMAQPALAVLPNEQLPDPAMEARARAISKGLRCLVCQNQTIDDSDAPLAHDLRVILRERLRAGATNVEARDYLVQRYGDYVLLTPPVEAGTLPLWFGPLAFVVVGVGGAAAMLRRRRTVAAPAPLSEAERGQVDDMLAGDPRA